MSAFKIIDKNTGHVLERVECSNRRAALAHGRSNIDAVEMSSREIVETIQAGKAITDLTANGTTNPPADDAE